MPETFDLILRSGVVATPGGLVQTDVAVRDGRIAAFGSFGSADAAQFVDCAGLHVLPGVIDTQVHFREPGLEHKEDISTGTAAAAMGGVTAVFDMPNTEPPTVGAADLADKCGRAEGRAWVDMAFFVGATPENVRGLADLERLAPGADSARGYARVRGRSAVRRGQPNQTASWSVAPTADRPDRIHRDGHLAAWAGNRHRGTRKGGRPAAVFH